MSIISRPRIRGGALPTALAVGALFALSGCMHVHHDHPRRSSRDRHVVVHHPGPPPHAPAHGRRHRHGDVDMVFDAALGVYVVVGVSNHYHDGHRYMRVRNGIWEVSPHLHGHWVAVAIGDVPPGLQEKHHAKHKHKKHHPPAKHGY